jgi:hypothetical protein
MKDAENPLIKNAIKRLEKVLADCPRGPIYQEYKNRISRYRHKSMIGISPKIPKIIWLKKILSQWKKL